MGSIGLAPAELLRESSLLILLISMGGGWVLYQFKIMRVLFCIAVFLFSSAVLASIFLSPSPYNLNQYSNLFFISVCYLVSACYLAKQHCFTPIIWVTSIAYLLAASFITFKIVFSTTYEQVILVTLIALSVEIAIYLYAPISVIVFLYSYSKVRDKYDGWELKGKG